jgi:diguanylate cyclase (GGDEF)-like protein/PAS domain S-box-containing protein
MDGSRVTAAAAILDGKYDPALVVLSVLIAILASATALDVASRISGAAGRLRLAWILAAGVAMGGGVWAMHFVAMLAFTLPVTIGFDIPLTLFSLALAVAVTSLSLWIVFNGNFSGGKLLLGGVLMGTGVAGMHYVGMAAIIASVTMSYQPGLVAASIAIAIGASMAALWIAARVSGALWRLAAAVVMGLAVAGMHYTGMAAICFTRAPQAIAGATRFNAGSLALAVSAGALVILILALVSATIDRRFAALRQREMEEMQREAARTEAALRALEAAQQSLLQFKAAVDHSSAGILIINHEGRITYANPTVALSSQYSEAELLGRHFAIFRSDANPDSLYESMWEKILRGESWRGELLNRQKDGGLQWNDVSISPITDANGEITHFVAINDDISERKKLEAELRVLATIDPLTGLLNRRSFFALAEQEVSRLRRHPGQLSVAMLDVDHFKAINDKYGHHAGDEVLRGLAAACGECLRDADILGRLGGEEFACLLPETSPERALLAAERLRAAVACKRITLADGREIAITISIGVAALAGTDSNIEAALQRADQALYAAKRAGRDCIRSAA